MSQARFLQVVYISIPAVVLAVSLAAMLSGRALMRPRSHHDDVQAHLARVGAMAVAERWEDAAGALSRLRQAWEAVAPRVRFASDREAIRVFDASLAELQGAVEGRDATQVRMLQRRMETVWRQLVP